MNEDLSRAFQTAPPLPIQPVVWNTGWSNGNNFDREHKLREQTISALFESETASASQLAKTADSLQTYAFVLVPMCLSVKPHRSHPIEFVWCFPSETSKDVQCIEKIVVMRSAMVAFEYMCVMCASCILWARAAMAYHVEHEDSEMQSCFQASFKNITLFLSNLPPHSYHIINQSQWSRLTRQALPIQLQYNWLEYFRVSIAHRYHMCCMLRCLQQDRRELALPVLHGAEITSFDVYVAARHFITSTPHLRHKQKEYANAIYINALANLIRFRSQSLIGDAEYALSQTLPHVTRLCISIVRCCLHTCEEAEVMPELLQRCNQLESIIASTDSVDTTELECMKWRSQLPYRVFVLS